MGQAKPVHTEPWDVNKRLSELGLKEAILLEAGERGWVAFASCTLNHPPNFAAISAWAEAICSLGEQLVPEGWRRIDESMYPLIINKSGTVAISVATGDENTGNKDMDPLTRSAKGPKTLDAIYANRRQMIFSEMLPPIESLRTLGRDTWLLLVHRDIAARQMRSELSRPISINPKGKVNAWAERIILSPKQLDGIPDTLLGDGNGPQSPEISIPIRRRA
jgi:hypothetical protein